MAAFSSSVSNTASQTVTAFAGLKGQYCAS